MKEGKLKFYSLAKYPNYEILMDSQLASAGANQARMLEKYEKNKNYIKTQLFVLKFVYAFLFVFLPFTSLIPYLEINFEYPGIPIQTLLFVYSFIFGMSFIMSILYVFLLGLFTTSSFMSGNAFKWLQTLPISKRNLSKLGFMTLFRNLDIPLIAMTLGFPIILSLLTRSILVFFVTLGASFVNVMFSFSILVIVSEKFGRIFTESKSSKKANLLRIITMAGFLGLAFSTSLLLPVILAVVEEVITVFSTNESAMMLNFILSMVPFPLASSYLIALSTTPNQIPTGLLITSLVGFVLFIIITILMYRFALKELRNVTSTEVEISKSQKHIIVELDDVRVKKLSKIKTYIHKDLLLATRDIQTFMFMILPIIYPIILIFSLQPAIAGEVVTPMGLMILWSVVLGVNQFIPVVLVTGLLNMEESGSSTIASLPVIPRDQAKAKLYLMLSIQAISFIMIGVILTVMTRSIELLILFILTIPIAWIFLQFMFQAKIRLFSRLKYKYILEELNKEHKTLKWIGMIASEVGMYLMILIFTFIIFGVYGIFGAMITLIIISVIGLSTLIFSFVRMFPKVEKIPVYQTGGLLRNIPILGTLVLVVVYIGFIFLAGIVEGLVIIPFLGLITLDNYTLLLFIDFFFQFGFLTLLWFYIIPRGLKLPKISQSFKEYAREIRLSTNKPIIRNILVGIGSFIIFGVVVFLGATLLGDYIFDPSILFGNPNPFSLGFSSLGWFLFIYMLIPGIWEEVAHRGVMIPMLLQKYGRKTSLIISSVVFGLAHTFNVIAYLLIGINPISVLFQVIYAALLGVAFGYMYIKTGSLLPGIILHYLIDSVGQLFFNTNISNPFLAGVFLIGFIGIIPMILIIIFVKLVVKEERNQEIFNS